MALDTTKMVVMQATPTRVALLKEVVADSADQAELVLFRNADNPFEDLPTVGTVVAVHFEYLGEHVEGVQAAVDHSDPEYRAEHVDRYLATGEAPVRSAL